MAEPAAGGQDPGTRARGLEAMPDAVIDDAVITLDADCAVAADGRIVLVNPQAGQLFRVRQGRAGREGCRGSRAGTFPGPPRGTPGRLCGRPEGAPGGAARSSLPGSGARRACGPAPRAGEA